MRKKSPKRATKSRRPARKKASSSGNANQKALWKTYRRLQMEAEKAWVKFRNGLRRNAKADILIRDHNHLLLLLGECNYMARECTRMAALQK